MERFLESDLLAIQNREKTFTEIALKYGTTIFSVRRSFNRRGYHLRNKKYHIKSPHKNTTCYSINDVANQLHLSRGTIMRAIKGYKIATLERLNIKLEVEVEYEQEEI